MAKIKVTARFKILEFIDGFVDNATANAIGKTVVDGAKELIASGQSPVRGYGRFEEYTAAANAGRIRAWAKGTDKENAKAIRKQARQVLEAGYPFSVMRRYPGKQVRPVNLYLSGEMLEAYDFVARSGSVFVGVMGDARSVEIAGYHNEGTDKMPQRRIVPGEGEEWAVSIMRDIRDLYGTRLAEIIRQSNK